MKRNNGQRPSSRLDLGEQRTPGLQPGKVDPMHGDQTRLGPEQDRVSMPSQTDPVAEHDGAPARSVKQGAGNSGRARPEPPVCFLKGDNVGAGVVGHAEDTGGVAPPVETDRLADIVAGDPRQPPGGSGRNGGHDAGSQVRPGLRRAIIALVWLAFAAITIIALSDRLWSLASVAALSLALSIAPIAIATRLEIVLPLPFILALAVFLGASLLFGEAFDTYERIWWWDVVLHGLSAIGLGMAGFLFVFMLFHGDRFAAPAWGLVLIATCIAITVGVIWELFEYSMDALFGFNMLKSGLDDTMGDIVTDIVGASLGALSGGLYLKGRESGVATILIAQFVQINRHRYPKMRTLFRRKDSKN